MKDVWWFDRVEDANGNSWFRFGRSPEELDSVKRCNPDTVILYRKKIEFDVGVIEK